jgi:DNA-binding NarL/FixJ family response regulator
MAGDRAGSGDGSVRTADIRVLLVDDHSSVRMSLAELLEDEDDFSVVGECEDGSEVVAAAARLKPDVVLMDLSMPVMDGLAATKALRATEPMPRVVVLTGDGMDARPRAEAAGAHALVPKGTRAGALLSCLRNVSKGAGDCSYCF